MKDLKKNGFDSLPQYEADQKVHHLGIHAGQIAPGVVLTSNLERTAVIAATFDHAQKVGEHREYITYTGEKHGVPMSVMSIGNGCMPTAIAVEELRHIGCRKMIKVGSCGAIQPDIAPGTILIPTGAVRGEGATLEYLNLQYPAVTDTHAFFALIASAKEQGVPVREGIVRTHDALFMESLFAHDGLEARIQPWRELGVLAIENEVAAMLAISSILQSQAGAVLVCVDNYTTGQSIDFDAEYAPLMATAIEIATAALAKLTQDENYL
jgi:uridine phosphorylase